MPSLGADMDHATLLEWLIAPGDTVTKGQVVAVVDTEKAAMDIESFEDGVVQELLVDVGTRVPVGAPLAVFGPAATRRRAKPRTRSAAKAPAKSTTHGPPVAEPVAHPAATPPVRLLARRLGVDVAVLSGTGPQGQVTHADVAAAATPFAAAEPQALVHPTPRRPPTRTQVSPLARRLARELGVDVALVPGTGRDGAVTADDVRRAHAADAASPAPVAPAPVTPAPVAPPATDRAEAMRHAIAVLMSRSKREVPHYYLSTTIDLGRALARLGDLNADRPLAQRLVPAALLLKATAAAVHRVPQLNGYWVDDALAPAEQVNLGVAVALRGAGLIAPAIPDADRLDLDALMAALRDLVTRARSGRLRQSEMTNGTLTVTNLGDRGVESVFGVIYPPQVALVGFGRVVERPWAVDGLLGVRPVVTATLSADHRATDGHLGGLFLAAVDELLQKPEDL